MPPPDPKRRKAANWGGGGLSTEDQLGKQIERENKGSLPALQCPRRTWLAEAAQMAARAHLLLVGSWLRLGAAGAIILPETEDEIAELLEDACDFSDALADIAAGRPQRRADGLPSYFSKIAEEWRSRRVWGRASR